MACLKSSISVRSSLLDPPHACCSLYYVRFIKRDLNGCPFAVPGRMLSPGDGKEESVLPSPGTDFRPGLSLCAGKGDPEGVVWMVGRALALFGICERVGSSPCCSPVPFQTSCRYVSSKSRPDRNARRSSDRRWASGASQRRRRLDIGHGRNGSGAVRWCSDRTGFLLIWRYDCERREDSRPRTRMV